MSSYRDIERINNPLFNATVSGVAPVLSDYLTTRSMASASFQFNYGAGLNAIFDVLGSLDGVTYSTMNAVIAPATGSAGSSLAAVDCGSIKYIIAKITPSSGSANVTVLGRAATRS